MSTEPVRIGIAPEWITDAKSRMVIGVRSGYVDAISHVGGVPILFAGVDATAVSQYLDGVDGLLLPGGGDIHPSFYGEEPENGLDLIEDDMSELHLGLARAALASELPTLGICLGCQVMNVALGGSLVQKLSADRPGAVEHWGKGGDEDAPHTIVVEPGSRLFAALGVSQTEVASRHRQAVRKLGTGLKATAVAPDTVIEGIEHESAAFFVGVQWHPEVTAAEE